MLAKLKRQVDEIRFEAACLAHRRYPAFVTAPPFVSDDDAALAPDDVPVFVFHSILPDEFEAQLRFLAENRYQTLTCDQFWRHLSGRERAPPRSVLLTIDDGRASVWTTGFALLETYRATAVVFVIPGYVREADEAPADAARRDPELMSWREIRTLAASGLVDIQSHTLFHHPVPTGGRIVGYVGPGDGGAPFDLAIAPGQEALLSERGLPALYGTPLYESAPLMSGQRCYRADPELAQACIAYVERSGGAGFFRSSDWRRALDTVVAEHRRRHGDRGRMMDPSEQRHALLEDLQRSRELIEAKLGGSSVRHLCYPYTMGSASAVDAAREVGYLTSFWGVLPGRRGNRPGDDPYHCPRLKADYLFRLPGRGRRSLAGIVAHKVRRRASGAAVY
jgi:peptidoglycan/xylan/chitin deacetylase (PgdA/CDA1 family)